MDDSERKIREARTTLLEDYPFFGYHALRLKLEKISSMMGIPSEYFITATNGQSLYYNPDNVKKLTRKECLFLAAHETLHVASGHCLPSNRENKDPTTYNMAADYWINAQLKKHKIGDMPKEGLYDPKYDDHKTWDTDAIYRDLKKQQQKDKNGKSSQGCKICNIQETKNDQGQSLSKAEEEDVKQDIEQANIEAEKLARGCGKGTGVEEVIVERIKNPPVDCWEILRRFVSRSITPSGLTWSKPNKRWIMDDFFLPGQLREGLGTVVIAIDTSGSITQDQLDSDAAHTKHILSQYHPEKIIIIYCDDQIKKIEEYGPYEDFKLKAYGRGGTSFTPPFEWLNEKNLKPACMIYFTDLESSDHPEEKDVNFPLIWGWHKSSYGGDSYKEYVKVGEVIEIQ